jgi:hypothetical protein
MGGGGVKMNCTRRTDSGVSNKEHFLVSTTQSKLKKQGTHLVNGYSPPKGKGNRTVSCFLLQLANLKNDINSYKYYVFGHYPSSCPFFKKPQRFGD